MKSDIIFGILIFVAVFHGNNGLSFKLDNVSDSSNRTELWEIYKNEFHRIYNSTEDQRRFGIFNATVTRILEHNKLYADKKITYTMGINQFTDLDPKEMFHGGVIEVEDLTREMGSPNGHGGNGGVGGLGGPAGSIHLEGFDYLPSLERVEGKNGTDGKGGIAGK